MNNLNGKTLKSLKKDLKKMPISDQSHDGIHGNYQIIKTRKQRYIFYCNSDKCAKYYSRQSDHTLLSFLFCTAVICSTLSIEIVF